jgi:Lar family restriction alleviation protein
MELKLCPFCGGIAILKDRYLNGVANTKNYWVVCGKCQARIQDRRSIKRAIEAWNNRLIT